MLFIVRLSAEIDIEPTLIINCDADFGFAKVTIWSWQRPRIEPQNGCLAILSLAMSQGWVPRFDPLTAESQQSLRWRVEDSHL